jgi:hypothetical protein
MTQRGWLSAANEKGHPKVPLIVASKITKAT